MDIGDFYQCLRAEACSEVKLDDKNPESLILPSKDILACLSFLRDNPETNMNVLEFQTAVDHPPDEIHMIYYLYSYAKGHRLALKVVLDRGGPEIESASALWSNADWNEREIYDLYGVMFLNHPDLRRLMMPEDWQGHPLRKDYLHPNVVVRPD